MVLPSVWCSGLRFSGHLHNQHSKCMVTVEAQPIWRANAELEAVSHPLQCALHAAVTLGQDWERREPFHSVEIALVSCSPHLHPPLASTSEQWPQFSLPGICFYF